MAYITPNWPAPPHVRAFTTTRCGWHGPVLTLESATLSELLEFPSEPAWLKQVHGNVAVPALPSSTRPEADASFTSRPNTVCVILTADCLPILICDRSGQYVAAIHAGWRGLASGVIENTIQAMQVDPKKLLVWLGPAIGPNHFEVGEDVYSAFIQHDKQAEKAFKPHQSGKWMANLYTLAEQRLNALDIHSIYGGDYCTYSQEELFFSYRREKGQTGRMASAIWFERA